MKSWVRSMTINGKSCSFEPPIAHGVLDQKRKRIKRVIDDVLINYDLHPQDVMVLTLALASEEWGCETHPATGELQ